MMIGISGLAGSGKDAAADYLVSKYGHVKVALADPLKRITKELYSFSDEQLWGPSALRNAPDLRYVRETHARHSWVDNPSRKNEDDAWLCDRCEFTSDVLGGWREKIGHECVVYLTPRFALQWIGTNGIRACYENTWVDLGLRTAEQLLSSDSGPVAYSGPKGAYTPTDVESHRPAKGVVFTDCRFRNEIGAFRAKGAKVVRIRRNVAGLQGQTALHASERDLLDIPDSAFDFVIDNNSTLDALHAQLDEMIEQFSS